MAKARTSIPAASSSRRRSAPRKLTERKKLLAVCQARRTRRAQAIIPTEVVTVQANTSRESLPAVTEAGSAVVTGVDGSQTFFCDENPSQRQNICRGLNYRCLPRMEYKP